MKKSILLFVLAVISAGCTESRRSTADNKYGIKFSDDPWVERVYIRCIEDMQENCQPEEGMNIHQIKELRTLETGNCVMKLDWRHSDGYEQWSERIFHLRITRIYTFKYGKLKEWLDVPQ